MRERDARFEEVQKRLIELRGSDLKTDDELSEYLDLHLEIRTYWKGYQTLQEISNAGKYFEPIAEIIHRPFIQQTYAEKLKDPRWQKKRLKIYERDNWTCQKRRSTRKTLSVHHLRYFKDAEPWEYPDDLLQTLCQPCHEEISK